MVQAKGPGSTGSDSMGCILHEVQNFKIKKQIHVNIKRFIVPYKVFLSFDQNKRGLPATLEKALSKC